MKVIDKKKSIKQLERQVLSFTKTNAHTHKDTFIRRGTSLMKTLIRYGATAAGGALIYSVFSKHVELAPIFPKKIAMYIKNTLPKQHEPESTAYIPQAIESIFDNAPEIISWFKSSKDFLIWYIKNPKVWVWFQPWIISYKVSLKVASALTRRHSNDGALQ